MLEWCSIAEMSTSSPGLSVAVARRLCATRLMPSVALRVKTISRVDAALMNARTRLARRLVRVGRPLAQLVDAAVDVGVDAGVVARDRVDHRRGFCVVAALSR